MQADVKITQLDVVKEYCGKLNTFRTGALACGALIDRQIRKIKSQMEGRKNSVLMKQEHCRSRQQNMTNRYKPIRVESIPGSEVAGDTDHQVNMKMQALEAAINEYNRSVDDINNKMTEIGLQTKTFCTILESETSACNQKVREMISIMERYGNS